MQFPNSSDGAIMSHMVMTEQLHMAFSSDDK